MPTTDAVIGAEALVHADELGIDTHGIRLLTQAAYAPSLRDGTVDPKATPAIVQESPSSAVLDGRHGFGPVAATRAMELAVAKARATGAAFVAVTNSSHFGAAAHYALLAVSHGFIGLSMTIGGLGVVPTNGRGRRLGINVISMAAPAAGDHPFLLDMATSVVSGGRLELARMRNQSVPLGWLVDADGRPTTNPDDFNQGGALLPLGGSPETGGYKGYGLSMMVDVLAGLLSGAGFAAQLGDTLTRPHFQGAIDVSSFQQLDRFTAMMDEMMETLRATEPMDEDCPVLVPGDKKFAAERDRTIHGIPLHPDVVARLRRLANDLGVPFPETVKG